MNLEDERDVCDRAEEMEFDAMAALSELNENLRAWLEKAEKEIEIPRAVNSLINETVNKFLMEMVREYKPENGCCYLVKNLTPETNVCFVHKIDENARTFENIELSKVPPETKKGDVLVSNDGKFAVSLVVTAEVMKIRQRILNSLENSIEDFQIEGNSYTVCDKSDDVNEPKMSLRDSDGKEFWGIDIDATLYEQICFGSKVRYENGKYILE